MSIVCLLGGGASVRLAALVTLVWTHSIEKVEWRETWTAAPDGLRIVEARVVGSGAGMEPGADARFEHGAWVWRPPLPPLAELHLARSGATADWRICHATGCVDVAALLPDAAATEPVRLVACD